MLKEPRLGEQARKLCFIFGLRHSPRDRGKRAWPAAVRQPDAHSAPLAPPRGLLYSLRPFEGTQGQRTRRSPGDPAQGHGARPPFAQPGLRVLHECILFRREAAEAMAAFLEHTLPAFRRVASRPSAGHHRSLVPSRVLLPAEARAASLWLIQPQLQHLDSSAMSEPASAELSPPGEG